MMRRVSPFVVLRGARPAQLQRQRRWRTASSSSSSSPLFCAQAQGIIRPHDHVGRFSPSYGNNFWRAASTAATGGGSADNFRNRSSKNDRPETFSERRHRVLYKEDDEKEGDNDASVLGRMDNRGRTGGEEAGNYEAESRDSEASDWGGGDDSQASWLYSERNDNYNGDNNYTGHQKNLLEYTKSILPPTSEHPPGTLTYTQIISISNCIDQWISTGEHRHLGAEQAELLLKRLIVERGGGRSLLSNAEKDDLDYGNNNMQLTRNENVTWEMYHLQSFLHYLDAIYFGKDFVDRVLSIVATFEEEYFVTEEEGGGYRSRDIEMPYKSIISSLCILRSVHAAYTAELLLDKFESRYLHEAGFYHSSPPTIETYNNVISCWKRSGRGRYRDNNGVELKPALPYRYNQNPCANIVMHMLQMYDGDMQSMARIRPNVISFNGAIASMAQEQIEERARSSSVKDATYIRTIGKTCHEFLIRMLEFYNESPGDNSPDLIAFSTVINALGRGKDPEDEARAREVLEIMLHLSGFDMENMVMRDGESAYEHDVFPRNKHFNVVLALMANRRPVTVQTLNHAKRYVKIMEILEGKRKELQGSDDMDMMHNSSYHMNQLQEELIDSGSSYDNMNEREERKLMSMTESAPDIFTYNTLLSIAARADCPREAEDILDEMITKSERGSPVKPDNISFNTVLLAWSKSNSPTGRLRAEQILMRMQEMADNGDPNVRPDHASLTTVINAIASSARRNREAPFQATTIIERMEKNKETLLRPDVQTYTSLIKCWAESGRKQAAKRAEAIIDKLHRRFEKQGYEECKPDSTAYNVAMNAIARSRAPRAAERAEALLNRMQYHYQQGDFDDLAPTVHSFSTVMLAWAHSGDPIGATRAEALLKKMHDLEKSGVSNVSPNIISYSTCILAWSKSGRPEAGERAEELLKLLEQHEKEGLRDDLKPNAIVYTTVMEALITSRNHGYLERVEDLLEHMIERSRRGDVDCAPTSTTFNAVLKAIRLSSYPAKYEKAEKLLNRMNKMYESGDDRVKPNIYTYNAFFSACANTQGDTTTKIKAFSMVLNALIDLQDSQQLRADSYTWPAVWKACENLLDVKRDLMWINRVFELTTRSGYVSEYLFNNMRRFLPKAYLQKKLKTTKDVNHLTVHDLPAEWTCHVELGAIGRKKAPGQSKFHDRSNKANKKSLN